MFVFSSQTQGVICSFEEATPELMYFQRKNIRPTPWNALFTISSKIKIPIRAFKKIAETVPMKWVTSSLDDRNASIVNEKAFVRYDHEKEVEVVLEKDGVIDAYQFGSTIVPFSDDDKKMMQYESGVKGLFLIGVTSRKNVDIHMLTGSGSYVVLAKQDDPVATTTLEAFIQAIYQRNCVGIARRIYRLNSAVRIGALFPVVTDEYRVLETYLDILNFSYTIDFRFKICLCVVFDFRRTSFCRGRTCIQISKFVVY